MHHGYIFDLQFCHLMEYIQTLMDWRQDRALGFSFGSHIFFVGPSMRRNMERSRVVESKSECVTK